jgi:phosphotransferase system enzyme I (PtsI)
MTLALSGHRVEGGIAIGQAHIIQRNELDIGEFRIAPAAVDAEIARLRNALAAAAAHLESLGAKLGRTAGRSAEEIIRTHIVMLADSSIASETCEQIRTHLYNAEWALQLQLESLLADFRQIDDPYIASRGEDAIQVVRMVQEILATEQSRPPWNAVPDRLVQTVIIATELTPGELAALHQRGVAGIVAEHGSPHSHTAILARSLGIPTVMGVRHGQKLVNEGEQLILDGHYGVVFAGPEESILKHYLQKQAESDRFRKSLEPVRQLEARSLDGHGIRLFANAEREEDVQLALQSGAEGIGLYRSEFLFLQGRAPGEQAQLDAYRRVLEMLEGRPLVIRTLDLGADKGAGLLDFKNLRSSQNPALGLRAVRLCLREPDLFKTQLRAILRCSGFGPVRCLIPMLTSASEVRAVRSLLAETQAELRAQGHEFDAHMPLGGMIEVPAAALALRGLAKQLDFLSVGTNDLIQYALATDRVDEQVAHLYEPQHPGVVQLLRHIFLSAQEMGIPVSVCGELAGERRFTRLLLALGLREFSMRPRHLLEVKQVIVETDIDKARRALDLWLEQSGDASEPSLIQHLDRAQREP